MLLAAGLDTRAFRLGWPEARRLFEPDMPDVLAFKAQVPIAHQAQPICERHVVEVDLREGWPAALREAGWHPEQPTAWLAEGILMYFAQPEREALLNRLTACSAPGSHLALELPAWQVNPQLAERVARGVVDRAALANVASTLPAQAASASEPAIADPAAWLRQHGWQPRVDDVADLFGAYGRYTPGILPSLAGSGPRRLATATLTAP